MPAFDNVSYASCAKYGVCAYPQPGDFETDLKEMYREYGRMKPEMLAFLGDAYENEYREMLGSNRDEFRYQQSGYWTQKKMRYDKYIRCYSPPGHTGNFKIVSFGVKNGEIMELNIPSYEGEKILLSTLITTVQEMYPGIPINIYDTGCLKLLSDKDIKGEPDQTSRVPIGEHKDDFILQEVESLNALTGGRSRRKTRRRKRTRKRNLI
jgi:hypothetical protein